MRLLSLFVLALGGCVSGIHQERVARVMPAIAAPAGLGAFAKPSEVYPSIGGDVLKGASAKEQAALREAAERQAASEP